MNKARTIESFVCIAVLVAVLFVGVWQIKPAQATTTFSDGFESGDFTAWTGTSADAATNAVQNITKHYGSYGYNITLTGNYGQGNVYESISGYSTVFLRVFFNFSQLMGVNDRYYRIADFSEDSIGRLTYNYIMEMGLWRDTAGTYKFGYNRNYPAAAANYANVTISAKEWHYAEMKFVDDSVNGEYTVYFDGVELVSETGLDTSAASMTKAIVGFKGYLVNDMAYLDDVVVSDIYIESMSSVPAFVSSWYNSTRAGNVTQFQSDWTCDEATLDKAWLASNNTGATANSSCVSITAGRAIFNMALNATAGNIIRNQWYANSSVGNETASGWFDLNTTSIPYTTWLHSVGTQFYDSGGNRVLLYGTNTRDFITTGYPWGIWFTVGTNTEDPAWNATNVGLTLDAMKVWGMNATRSHLGVQWWQSNYTNYWGVFREYAQLCANRGINVILDFYCVNQSNGAPELPYAPWGKAGDEAYLPTTQSFIDFWVNVTLTLRDCPNVIYDLWNEPHGNSTLEDSWIGSPTTLGIAEQTAIAIRHLTDQPIIIQWDYGDYKGGDGLNWILHVAFNESSNWAVTTHLYRDGTDTNWNSDYATLLSEYNNHKFFNQTVPFLIPEIGLDGAAGNLTAEQTWFQNSLQIFNTYNISYLAWTWINFGLYRLLGTAAWNNLKPPSVVNGSGVGEGLEGAIFVNSINPHPFVWTVGNETLNGYNYIYSNNTAWSTTWGGNQLTVTYSGATQVRVWWNVSSTYPINGTLQCLHSNGTKVNATDYYDSATNLIRLNSTGGSTWTIGYSLTYAVTVTITLPTNTTYTTSTVPVEISASGGTIDTIWWNCKNGTSWIYGTNQTYTAPTSMTGFVNGTSYTFYAWANNTDGNWDEETVMFTVLIITLPYDYSYDYGSWW